MPEIHNGTVEIKAIAREAGSRSKVAVWSRQDGLDPVGATVGQRGARVQAVVAELAGEKIDVIPWNDDPAVFVANALSPAQVLDVQIDEEHRIASVTVPERMLSLAIGREGQNARLAAKLTGWRIDIRSDVSVAEAAKVAEEAASQAVAETLAAELGAGTAAVAVEEAAPAKAPARPRAKKAAAAVADEPRKPGRPGNEGRRAKAVAKAPAKSKAAAKAPAKPRQSRRGRSEAQGSSAKAAGQGRRQAQGSPKAKPAKATCSRGRGQGRGQSAREEIHRGGGVVGRRPVDRARSSPARPARRPAHLRRLSHDPPQARAGPDRPDPRRARCIEDPSGRLAGRGAYCLPTATCRGHGPRPRAPWPGRYPSRSLRGSVPLDDPGGQPAGRALIHDEGDNRGKE